MRYLRWVFLAVLAAWLVTVALANRAEVTLTLLPQGLADLVGWNATLTVPLFLALFAGIVAGLLIGMIWEWLRERRIRAEAKAARREVSRLEGELTRARGTAAPPGPADDVLAIVDGRRQA